MAQDRKVKRKSFRCEYPVATEPLGALECGKPAVWETEDLQEVSYLCDEHCCEAMRDNHMHADPVGS